jgi:hypothetical protein
MHPVPVEFNFVQPVRPVRRPVDQLGELRFDPTRERRRFGAPVPGERSCHVLKAAPGMPRFIMAELGGNWFDQARVARPWLRCASRDTEFISDHRLARARSRRKSDDREDIMAIIRAFAEGDLPAAQRICLVAFGTLIGAGFGTFLR